MAEPQAASNDIIAQKSQMVVKASGLKASAVNFGGIMAFITQLMQALARCGGVTTPAQVRGVLVNPDRQQIRVSERLARQNFRRDPVAQESVLHGTYEVGKVTTEDEAVKMYIQANGKAPGE